VCDRARDAVKVPGDIVRNNHSHLQITPKP
jgi:hypothetical protein